MALGAYGEVVTEIEDIAQSILIILRTRLGSDPLRPEFGSDLWRYIDYPADRAVPHLVRESLDAIERWEPRVEVLSVQPRYGDQLGQVALRVNWRPLGSTVAGQTTEVAP